MSALALPEAGFVVPDYVAPIEAWRVWRVALRDGEVVLESLYADTVWRPGVALAAVCETGHRPRWRPWRLQRNDHSAPDFDCLCGIYGVPSAAAAREHLEGQRLIARFDRVLGRVALWGDVVESEHGWRASHAYPLELLLPVPTAGGGGVRRRAYLDEILLGLEAYRVPVDVADVRGVVGAWP